MRIAICGAHAVGKTSLVNALADVFPDHSIVDEPYHALTALGHIFEDPPSAADFEAQLEFSIESARNTGDNVIFDRCPADLLAYLAESASADVVATYWTRSQEAVTMLDLVIYLPVERPDRIHVSASEYPRLRRRVDRRLRHCFQEDGLLPESVLLREVSGSVRERIKSVLGALSSGRA